MGGNVAITLRTPDNKIYKMSRWTNIMPYFINNSRLFLKKQKHIDEFLEQWLLMEKDWESNKDTGNFEFTMTGVYFPPSGIAPEDYGLVVVDMINDVILTSQGYCSIGKLNTFQLKQNIDRYLDSNKKKNIENAIEYFLNQDAEEDLNEIQIIKELYDNNFIKSINTEKKEYSIDKFKDFHSLIKFLKKSGMFCEVNLNGFNIENFEEYNKEELLKMKSRIIELGFELNDSDLKQWEETFKEIDEEFD